LRVDRRGSECSKGKIHRHRTPRFLLGRSQREGIPPDGPAAWVCRQGIARGRGIDEAIATDLIHAGISGIFLKRDSPNLLAQAIRHIVGGGVWFRQEQLKNAMASQPQTTTQPESGPFTAREQQVLSYVFEGFTNRQIAERIGVSTSSVKATIQQLFSKTGVRTRSQLVRIVLEQYKDQL